MKLHRSLDGSGFLLAGNRCDRQFEDYGSLEKSFVVREFRSAAVVAHQEIETLFFFGPILDDGDEPVSGDAPVFHAPVAVLFSADKLVPRVDEKSCGCIFPEYVELFARVRAMEVNDGERSFF